MKKVLILGTILSCSLLITSCAGGTPSSNQPTSSPSASSVSSEEDNYQTLSEFHSIEIDVSTADINLIPGDEWSVSYHLSEKEPLEQFGIENGTLYIDTTPISHQYYEQRTDYFITVTVPTGAYLSDIDIEVMNGDINVRDLTCNSASLSAISGTITADEVVAWELEMESDFGTLSGINLSVDKMDAETASGDIHLDGSFDSLSTLTTSGTTAITGSITMDGVLKSTSGNIELSLDHTAALMANSAGTITWNGIMADSSLRTDDGVPVLLDSSTGDLSIYTPSK